MTPIDFISQQISKTGVSPALAFQGELVSGYQLLEKIDAAKNNLEKMCRAGDVVILYGDFSINSISYLLALIEIGAVIVPLTKQTCLNVESQLCELTPNLWVDVYGEPSIKTLKVTRDINKHIVYLQSIGNPD